MQNYKMVSINTALQIDLVGQICSESIGTTQYSGTGGAADFATGAVHSEGGKSIIAVKSTARNGEISTIQPVLNPGSIVTISRNDIDYIVTEYGIATMKGTPINQRVENLINIAHPDFRDELREGAARYRLW
jgi:acyl-CoA hydrolase